MKRLGIVLEDSAVAWKYQNNTVIIAYTKPQKCIEIEAKKKTDLATMGKSNDDVMMQNFQPGKGGSGGSSAVKSLLGGPGGGQGGQ